MLLSLCLKLSYPRKFKFITVQSTVSKHTLPKGSCRLGEHRRRPESRSSRNASTASRKQGQFAELTEDWCWQGLVREEVDLEREEGGRE
ncbi:Cxxc-Type Zinc Finger Protein 1 [Manis pentadactyla]|nr:Cxxc-Type Zinc Finger Protein 1 [Manis pentadactyla]